MPMNGSTGHVKSLLKTQKLAHDSKGKNFTTTPETTQWKCTCGGCNVGHKNTCRFCGEARPGRE